MTAVCSIPGCVKSRAARGWCGMHYARYRAHGDPLVTLRPEYGEVQRFYREVVLLYDGDECLIWPFCRHNGYAILDSKCVHRFLCEEAHGPAPTPDHEAAHSCGKGTSGCVTKRHLSWKTHKDNEADKAIHGTLPRGERQGRSKLTETNVREIRTLKGKMTERQLGERFGVHSQTIGLILRGKNWAWLSAEPAGGKIISLAAVR